MFTDELKVYNLRLQTEKKLIFFLNHFNNRLPHMKDHKATTVQKDLDICKRLINMEPVSMKEYQHIITKMSRLIQEEESINKYLRK